MASVQRSRKGFVLSDGTLGKGEHVSGFQSLLNYHLVEWRDGYSRFELTLEDKHLNRHGVLHGGVITTLLDTACGFAATWCPFPGRVRRVQTLSLNTSFVSVAKTNTIFATGSLRGGGRRIIFCSAEVTDSEGHLVALGEGTFRYRTGSELPEGIPL